MGGFQMGNRPGPQSGVQVLPAHGKGQEAVGGRRVPVEANGRSCSERDVANCRGELICIGGRSESAVPISSASCATTWSSKKKSNVRKACRQKKRVMRPAAHSATLRGSGNRQTGRGGRHSLSVFGRTFTTRCGR